MSNVCFNVPVKNNYGIIQIHWTLNKMLVVFFNYPNELRKYQHQFDLNMNDGWGVCFNVPKSITISFDSVGYSDKGLIFSLTIQNVLRKY